MIDKMLPLMLSLPIRRATQLCSATLIGSTAICHPDYFFQGSMVGSK